MRLVPVRCDLPSRHSSTELPYNRHHLYRALERAIRPRKRVSVREWADQYRVIPSKSGAEYGRWSTDRAPYLAEVMECLSPYSAVQQVVMMLGSQMGKTEMLLNWMGYIIHQKPSPTLLVLSTDAAVDLFVSSRFDPMVEDMPILKEIVGGRARNSGNRKNYKDFPGGYIAMVGSNSPTNLASMPIRYAICDEVDRYPISIKNEGSPIQLIRQRLANFHNRKIVLSSTPTQKGVSLIDQEFEQSDQREFRVPCPHCGHYQPLKWRHNDSEFGLVYLAEEKRACYLCRECGALIEEHDKPLMLQRGHWVPKYPDRPIRGYQLNALYSPVGMGLSWSELWRVWEVDCKNVDSLRSFVNTRLGEAWEDEGVSTDSALLMNRLEQYPVPLVTAYRTAGVDVQKDRLEFSVVDWGAGEEAWLFDHVIVVGDTGLTAVWDDLEELLTELKVDAVLVDTGFQGGAVDDFVSRRLPFRVYAGKGIAGLNRSIVQTVQQRASTYRKQKKRVRREPIGVSQAKSLLMSRLNKLEAGAGYIHFPNKPAFDDEYFLQLTAEKLVRTRYGGEEAYQWVTIRRRNEALDCLVYALAALRLSGVSLEPRPVVQPVMKKPTPSSYIR